MLVLSRKEGERIAIGDNITVTVVRITHNAVRIGIEATDGSTVMRKELTAIREPADHPEPPSREMRR